MSDLPSDALDYQAVVAEYFLALRGAGLLLSPLDQDLVAEWERRGLPVPIVCRGLRRGVERLAEERPPRPVRSVRALLEDAGRTPDPARSEGYRAACRALAAEAAHPGTPLERAEAAIVAADRHVLSAWLRSLPRAERAGLGRRVRLLAGARPRGTRPGVHREALRAHLLDLARSAGLTCLRGSV